MKDVEERVRKLEVENAYVRAKVEVLETLIFKLLEWRKPK